MVLHRLLCRLYHAKCANSLQTCPMTQVKVDDIVDNRIVTRERQNVGDDLHGPTRANSIRTSLFRSFFYCPSGLTSESDRVRLRAAGEAETKVASSGIHHDGRHIRTLVNIFH
jgi:hypothetical protein